MGDVLLVKEVIAIIHITNTAKVFCGGVVSGVSHGDDARLTGADVNFRSGSLGVRRRKYDEGNLTYRHVTLAVLRSRVASDRCVFSGDRLIANAVEGKHTVVARVFRGVNIQSGPRIRLRNLLVVVSRHRFLPTGRHRQDAVPDKAPELYAVATKVWFPVGRKSTIAPVEFRTPKKHWLPGRKPSQGRPNRPNRRGSVGAAGRW